MSKSERWFLLNPVGDHGIEVVGSDGSHFCILARVWHEWLDNWMLYGTLKDEHAPRTPR